MTVSSTSQHPPVLDCDAFAAVFDRYVDDALAQVAWRAQTPQHRVGHRRRQHVVAIEADAVLGLPPGRRLADVVQQRGRGVQLKDLAILGWRDKGDVLVVTFGEIVEGQRTGAIKRQYWGKEGGLWKIFYEGVIG